jgi:hypothetical protein
MAGRRRSRELHDDERSLSGSVPAQQDEADILAEAEVEPDENGDPSITIEKARELGALDADTVRNNRRINDMVGKRRANQRVNFNVDDPIQMFDGLLQTWPTNTMDVKCVRLTGSSITKMITSRPRNGVELYEAIKTQVHGQSEEAEYQIQFIDTTSKQWRGKAKITMPDTRPPGQQGQPPMTQPYYPPGYQPPPGYPPPPWYAPQPPPQQQPQAAPAQQQPVVVQAPQGMDMGAMLSAFQQMSELLRSWQPAPPPQQPQQQPQAAPYPYMPPPPPPSADPTQMMAWMQQMADIVRSMQPPQQRGPQTYPAQPASTLPTRVPPMQPPPGTVWAWIQDIGWVTQPIQGAGPGPGYRPPYYPRGDQGGVPPAYGPPRVPQSSPLDSFRDALGVVRSAYDMVDEFEGLRPARGDATPEATTAEDDDSPLKIIDTGKGKIVVNKTDGSLRGWETGLANLPELFKWGGEQVDKVVRARNERERERAQPKVLPPGYVEVGPGYQPPPGYTAIPVDPQTLQPVPQFPPPPANIPPPISTPQAPSGSSWGPPTEEG